MLNPFPSPLTCSFKKMLNRSMFDKENGAKDIEINGGTRWVDCPNICSFCFPSWLAKKSRYASCWELSEQIHYCFKTGDLAGLACCQLSHSELAGNSEQVFNFKSIFCFKFCDICAFGVFLIKVLLGASAWCWLPPHCLAKGEFAVYHDRSLV